MSTLSVNSIKDVQSFDFANTSFASAYGTANSGYVVANASFTYGNSSYTVANAAFGKANTALQNTSGVIFAGDLTVPTTFKAGSNSTIASAYHYLYGSTQLSSTANWNYSGLNIVRHSTNTTTPRHISFMLDGDSLSNTTVGAYNSIWGLYSGTPTTGSTSSSLQGQMVYASYSGHQWYINGSERMRIDSSGNVAIGMTNPTYRMDVTGPVLGNGVGNTSLLYRGTVNDGNNDAFEVLYNRKTAISGWPYADLILRRSVDNTNNQTNLIFGADAAGGTFQFNTVSLERMRIDSSGRVTMPYQPAFRAYSSSGSYSTTGVDIAFGTTDFNTGSHYNTSNGRFTAPVSGVYHIIWSTSSFGATSFSLDLFINGSTYSYSEQNNSLNYFVTGQSQLRYLNAGDYVTLRLRSGTINLSQPSTNFQAFLVG